MLGLYDLKREKFIVSRGVIFYETKFPYKDSETSQCTSDFAKSYNFGEQISDIQERGSEFLPLASTNVKPSNQTTPNSPENDGPTATFRSNSRKSHSPAAILDPTSLLPSSRKSLGLTANLDPALRAAQHTAQHTT